VWGVPSSSVILERGLTRSFRAGVELQVTARYSQITAGMPTQDPFCFLQRQDSPLITMSLVPAVRTFASADSPSVETGW
jgi:hypothetical protein